MSVKCSLCGKDARPTGACNDCDVKRPNQTTTFRKWSEDLSDPMKYRASYDKGMTVGQAKIDIFASGWDDDDSTANYCC